MNSTPTEMDSPLIAVTGASGYVGGRLVPVLLDAGYRVRVIARNPSRLAGRDWVERVTIAAADVTDAAALATALRDVHTVYYLVHSLTTGPDFASLDRHAALTVGQVAREAGVKRIIYLGGICPDLPDRDLSPHLASRREVGVILRASGVPTVVLRAAVILGSGSASFEMMRYLTENLPAMITPRWVDNRIQPIAIRDVLHYLVGAIGIPEGISGDFDIGGPDTLTYRQMMRGYAEVAHLTKRAIVAVPVLTPRLSSHWVGVVTPVPAAIARPLVDSLIHEVVCRDRSVSQYIPDPPGGLTDFRTAVRLALRRIHDGEVTTRWSSAALPGAPSDPLPTDPSWAGGKLYVDERQGVVAASPEQMWQVIEAIGGARGWYSWPLAWQLRGAVDRLVGGPGLRRGRRDQRHLRADDAVDFWRVEAVEPGQRLLLRAEMRLPGLAWLELTVRSGPQGTTQFRQRALFHPHGLAGHLYWWLVTPFHGVVFGQMHRNMACAAVKARS